MVTEAEMRFEVNGPNDDFRMKLRRQGWHLDSYRPVYADPQVIRPRGPIEGFDLGRMHTFDHTFGDNTIRKLLRAVIDKPRSETELAHICGNVQKRQDALTFFKAWSILENEGDMWRKGAACEGINDVGRTLEWYVAEWFRRELQVPARHGVTIAEVPSGDLDVVAFVDTARVMVECKSGNPKNIDEAQLRQFVQRTDEFRPEVAVLLVDTESDIEDDVIAKLDNVLDDLRATRPERVAGLWQPFFMPAWSALHTFESEKGLYWSAPNIYVTNVTDSIDRSLSAILRLYHSYIRHLSYNDTSPVRWQAITSFDKDFKAMTSLDKDFSALIDPERGPS